MLEAETPTPNPKIPKKHRVCTIFSKVRANFPLLPCELSHEPSRNCSEKLVTMNFSFWVDFPLICVSRDDFSEAAGRTEVDSALRAWVPENSEARVIVLQNEVGKRG